MRETGGGEIHERAETAADARFEKSLFAFHSAVDVDSFWTGGAAGVRRIVPLAQPRHDSATQSRRPTIAKWQHSIPDGAIDAEPLEAFLSAHPRSKIVRDIDVFPDRGDLLKSAFYRDYMKPRKCKHAMASAFGAGHDLLV